LRDGINEAHSGQLDDAMASMRGYVALRSHRMATRPTQGDAEAALLAATCAALRGDAIEFAAIRKLVDPAAEVMVPVVAWIDVMTCALAGDLHAVVAAFAGEVSPIVAPLRTAIVVVAAERGADRLDAQAERALLALFDSELSAEASARVLVALALGSFARGDRITGLSYLRELPETANPFHGFVGALAQGHREIEWRWNALPEAERDGAAQFATAYATCADADVGRLLYDICVPASGAARASLLATLVGLLVREGSAQEAIDLVESTTELADAPVVRVARCHALVALQRASEALPLVATGEQPCEVRTRDLALLVAAAAGDGDRVTRLCMIEPAVVPAPATRSAVLIYAATAPAIPRDLPAWCEPQPDDPDGLHAWALLELRRGRGEAALTAFERALVAKPMLAADPSARDSVDAALLHVTRNAVRAGDLGHAQDSLEKVRNPRFEREASLLRAMVLIRGTAARERTRLDAATLALIVRSLLATLPPESADHRAVSRLAHEADELRARWLLGHDRVEEARPVVRRLGDAGNASFLAAVLAILEGQPLADIERELIATGATQMAGVLLAEVRGARGDVAARVELLEQIRDRGGPSEDLIDEALVQAYQSARRGLDAKRVALEELRRRGKLGTVLATELRESLAFEAPPTAARYPVPASTGTLPSATLPGRAHLLVDHASRHGGAAVDAALLRFKRAVLDNDLVAAATAERAVLTACRGARP
jgi:hypothetical protein